MSVCRASLQKMGCVRQGHYFLQRRSINLLIKQKIFEENIDISIFLVCAKA